MGAEHRQTTVKPSKGHVVIEGPGWAMLMADPYDATANEQATSYGLLTPSRIPMTREEFGILLEHAHEALDRLWAALAVVKE